ncbi:MAG TPA: PEP/pyruvate-binding domain-containing protein, partial [Gemmataceae bacterium]|nr:PEP/pyruvate-binding domain-containing protein [Gemmataceae bacterium]
LLVAVRSGAAVSMPGMMDTVLNVGRPEAGDPWDQLRRAIDAVFLSWNSERAVLYRQHHRIDGLLGTAVTVQAMCQAEGSGVLFTANPVDSSRPEILIEAVPGLGEALVLGKVTPDCFVLDKSSLRVVSQTLANRNGEPLLGSSQLADLARLGLRVEAYFGHPCDIEWSLAGGQFYLLQSRPIKAKLSTQYSVLSTQCSDEERERVRQEEIAALRARAEPGGTIWSRFNLYEVLPEPTPMTWAIVRRFMSGRGGFGLMYRDLGFDPDPALDEDGVYDLVCGRPYCNLSQEPRLHFRRLPFIHDFATLKAAPQKALYPQPTINAGRAGWRFWLFAPIIIPRAMIQVIRAELRQRETAKTLPERLREEVFPGFAAETTRAAAEDLTRLDGPALLARLEHWTQRSLVDFARDSLKPTALAGLTIGKVERLLFPALGPERTRSAVGELTLGVRPDPEADLPGAIRDLTAGRLDLAEFAKRFGHRGDREMELSQPRWGESAGPQVTFSESVPSFSPLPRRQGRGVGGEGDIRDENATPSPQAFSPEAGAKGSDIHRRSEITRERIEAKAKLSREQRAALDSELKLLNDLLALRETAKHYFMLGYAEIRRVLVELDRRHGPEGGIFFLTPDELPSLVQGKDLTTLIAERRRRRELVLSLEVPTVLFSDDLEAIGRRVEAAAVETLHGVALSAGVAEGVALVLQTPDPTAIPDEPYILVCPSTDPAWLPLFIRARGLVMETGGVLSHGAIVAREFGLPAVAGLPDVQWKLRSGQRLRMDGGTGAVSVLLENRSGLDH